MLEGLTQKAMMEIMEPLKETNPYLASKEFELRMAKIVQNAFTEGDKFGYARKISELIKKQ